MKRIALALAPALVAALLSSAGAFATAPSLTLNTYDAYGPNASTQPVTATFSWTLGAGDACQHPAGTYDRVQFHWDNDNWPGNYLATFTQSGSTCTTSVTAPPPPSDANHTTSDPGVHTIDAVDTFNGVWDTVQYAIHPPGDCAPGSCPTAAPSPQPTATTTTQPQPHPTTAPTHRPSTGSGPGTGSGTTASPSPAAAASPSPAPTEAPSPEPTPDASPVALGGEASPSPAPPISGGAVKGGDSVLTVIGRTADSLKSWIGRFSSGDLVAYGGLIVAGLLLLVLLLTSSRRREADVAAVAAEAPRRRPAPVVPPTQRHRSSEPDSTVDRTVTDVTPPSPAELPENPLDGGPFEDG